MEPFGPGSLHAALGSVPPGAWSLPSSYSQTKVHHGYRRVVLVDSGRWLEESEPFRFALRPLEPVHAAWLSWIDPGGFIVPHSDGGPWRERWQVPIRAAGWFRQGEQLEPEDGLPFKVRHWEMHSVANPTDRPRVHIVVDRDVVLDLPARPFRLYPIPPDMEVLVCHAEPRPQ